MIVTISMTFKTPTWTVLELLRDLPEVPVLCHPTKRRCTITRIDFKYVKCGPWSESCSGDDFPESDPLSNFLILIDNLSLLEAKSRVRIHRGSLNKWLELIAGVSWGTLETQDLFDGLLSQNGITETVGDVGELLLLCPLNIKLSALHMVVVMIMLSVVQSLLEINFLGLRKPGAGGFSPSVVKVKEHVVQILILITDWLNLVEMRRNIRNLIKVLGSHLANVKIN